MKWLTPYGYEVWANELSEELAAKLEVAPEVARSMTVKEIQLRLIDLRWQRIMGGQ